MSIGAPHAHTRAFPFAADRSIVTVSPRASA
jgi:hypothetical protein